MRLGVAVYHQLEKRAQGTSAIDYDPPLGDRAGQRPVFVYFGSAPGDAYQVTQWVEPLRSLASVAPVRVVTRHPATLRLLRDALPAPLDVVYARTNDALSHTYEHDGAKVILYINNPSSNFDSLQYRSALHVFLGHGESDKISSVSNRNKAYDVVVVAGQAAIDRHRTHLLAFDESRLVPCGRPQLDVTTGPAPAPAPGRRTVLYTPTWGGPDDNNNYTSLDRCGVEIVRAVLARPDLRLVYKPHPRIVDSTDPGTAAAHRAIRELITTANRTDGGVHLVLEDGDVLALFDAVDLLVSDISSVTLDFLYMRPDVPIVMTDRYSDPERLAVQAPLSRATEVIDAAADVPGVLAGALDADHHRSARRALRDYYFGFERGQSTQRFHALVIDTMARRDRLVTSRGQKPQA